MKTYILLDRSRSMIENWNETISGINEYAACLKGKQEINLTTFYSILEPPRFELTELYDGPQSKWKKLKVEDCLPIGMTPLNDALGETILKMFSENHKRAVLVVMTDGLENTSKTFSDVAIKRLLREIERRDWQIVFLGAKFDDIKEQAASYGINAGTRGIISNDIRGTYRELATKVNQYQQTPLNASSAELSATMDWSMDEQNKVKKDT